MQLRNKKEKYTLDVIERLGIKVGGESGLSDRHNKASKEAIRNYSDDDIYESLRRKGIKFEEQEYDNTTDDQELTLNCMKCNYTSKTAKELMKHNQSVHRNNSKQIKASGVKKEIELKFKEEHVPNNNSYSRSKILNYLKDKNPLYDDLEDDITYDINNNFQSDFKLEDDFQETFKIEQVVNRNLDDFKEAFQIEQVDNKNLGNLEAEEDKQDEIFNCADCEFTTKKAKRLRKHILRFHAEENAPQDIEVPQKEEKILKYRNGKPRNDEWRNHMIINSNDEDVVLNCSGCEYTATKTEIPSNQERNMRRHIQRVHLGNKSYERGTKRTDALMEEGDSKDGIILNCNECDYSSRFKKNIRKHIERVHLGVETPEKKEEPAPCPECPYIGKIKKYLMKHMRNCHLSKRDDNLFPEISCDQCLYTTRQQRYLRRHYNETHSEQGERKCTYEDCQFTTKRNERLKRHVQVIHLGIPIDRSNVKRYPLVYRHQCDQCDFKAPAPSSLRVHQKSVHLKIMDQVCDQCNFKTTTAARLRQHVNFVHLKIKDHECPKCGVKMSTAIKVRLHIKAVHDKTRDEVCQYCPSAFTRKDYLKDHIKRMHEKTQNVS